ncbi:MAG: 30S ribosomal protein S16 [Chitinispirillia bacterium]|nr:30S ribosomal protein S16 [Chitinispirillia bacterium]MCL2267928.1 30S ribosomal protein S16 [Chitinispirillia bacterium]
MAVKIRLARTGRKKISTYRVVAADSRTQRDGKFLETIGFYDPQTNPKTFTFKTDRVAYWIKQGATPTLTVKNLLRQDNFYEKMAQLDKGAELESISVERKPERKRKAKVFKKKSED